MIIPKCTYFLLLALNSALRGTAIPTTCTIPATAPRLPTTTPTIPWTSTWICPTRTTIQCTFFPKPSQTTTSSSTLSSLRSFSSLLANDCRGCFLQDGIIKVCAVIRPDMRSAPIQEEQKLFLCQGLLNRGCISLSAR